MIIKVCGMRDADNIKALDEAKIADWMGFIFYPKSSRHVSHVPAYLPKNMKRVGVFVNSSIEEITTVDKDFCFDIIQLHGDEDAGFCRCLRSSMPTKKIIRMIQVSGADDLEATEAYRGAVDYFLFETKCSIYGGSGKQFDWDILQQYRGSTPFLITGGIGPDDSDKVNAFHHPLFAGIDLNSKFEVSPAYKDIDALNKLIRKLYK